MIRAYAEALYYRQQNFLEYFKIYLRKKSQHFQKTPSEFLEKLTRPRLKIALVTETWAPEINGVALSLLQLCKGLQKQGHKILLIRPTQKQKCTNFSPNKECLVVPQSIPRYVNLQFGWPQYGKVAQAIESFEPDVVHIVTEGPLGFAALHVAKNRNIVVSSGFHSSFHEFSRFFDLAFLVKPIQHYLRWFHNHTQLTCVPSTHTQQGVRDFGVTCPLAVVGRGVDTTRFSSKYRSVILRKRWNADENIRVMLYVGRLSPEKEIHVLMDAYKKMLMQQQKVKLVIVGDGPDRSRLQKMPIASEVIFTGILIGTELAEAYASADVFVFASQVETFGNVVLEAMASGLPVVAYDYACAQQQIQHGQSGWLCPLGQTEVFVQTMLQLPEQKTLHQMGRVAMQQVQKTGWQHAVQQFETALYQVVQEHRRIR